MNSLDRCLQIPTPSTRLSLVAHERCFCQQQPKMSNSGVSLLFIVFIFGSCDGTKEPVPTSRDPSNLRLMVIPYPHYRHPEPYTYPGPSPVVKIPPKLHEPYSFISPRPVNNQDFENLPKWCKSMWEKEECGMKCWMLRKICRNIANQLDDNDTSPSISHPIYNNVPYYNYYKKPVPSVAYTKTNMPNMYYAQPGWQYSYHKRQPYYRYPPPSSNTEFGLNPQFTYVDADPKIHSETTTHKPEETTTTETTTTSTEKPENSTKVETKAKPIRLKGTYPVKVTTVYRYPVDSEVTTLSPHMFEYDQYGNKGYYGDRIYMSAVMPVSERQQRNSPSEDSDYDDFDEMMFDP